jgi:D-3-phosphoglycerate dehydrogenase
MQMTVVYYDTRDSVHNDVAQRCASLDELLAQSDFVLLCVPLSAATRRMITAKELNRMKKSAYLINVARGEVVDERDLARRLKQHDIAGAATDVLSEEPPSFFHTLYGCPNLIITPHVAGNIYTYREAIRRRFVMNMRAFIEKKPLDGLYKQGAQGVIDGY